MEEFRINNYIVDYETEPYYFKIEEIKRNEQGILACYYRNGSCWSIAPDKVELTEEILLKCGFKFDYNDDWYVFESEKGISISHIIGGLTYYFGNLELVWTDILNEVKYLHQLQNLYFALTNEELTLNL